MNFIFISPDFPFNQWRFCDRLRQNGVNVLAIGDAPYFSLEERLRNTLTEYYYVESLRDYDQVYRAVAFFTFKYGRVDWLESNNDFWILQDARLRTDFHILTGADTDTAALWTDRLEVRSALRREDIPTALGQRLTSPAAAESFLSRSSGFPFLAKPSLVNGSRAGIRIRDQGAMRRFFDSKPEEPWIMEEWLPGDIFTYHAITGREAEPLFESVSIRPSRSTAAFCASTELPEPVRSMGRRALAALKARSRFVRLDFCRLAEDRQGLGRAGDFVALIPHLCPEVGYIPDLINFAHSTDVYQIWADMVTQGRRMLPEGGSHRFCAGVFRRDGADYAHSHEDVTARYWQRIVLYERSPEQLWERYGQRFYAAYADDLRGAMEFTDYVEEARE